MIKIYDQLEYLRPYLISIRYANNKLWVVDMIIKNSWVILDDDIIRNKKGNKSDISDDDTYYIFYTDAPPDGDNPIDCILNYTKKVIDYNIDVERKEALFKEKVEELKHIFDDNSIESLSSLAFDVKTK